MPRLTNLIHNFINNSMGNNQDNKYVYSRAIIFGTFDQLHKGHKDYISRAFELANKVVIMVMSDKASQPTKIYTPHSFEKRCKQIFDFIGSMGWEKSRFTIDTWRERPQLYKRMLTKPLVDVVITGHEYLDRTYEMFERRLDLNLPQFTIVLQPRYREHGKELTSTSIRLNLDKLDTAKGSSS